MVTCDDLTSFADGELSDERADAFRDHLRGCEPCQGGLVEAMQLSAHLSTLASRKRQRFRLLSTLVGCLRRLL